MVMRWYDQLFFLLLCIFATYGLLAFVAAVVLHDRLAPCLKVG